MPETRFTAVLSVDVATPGRIILSEAADRVAFCAEAWREILRVVRLRAPETQVLGLTGLQFDGRRPNPLGGWLSGLTVTLEVEQAAPPAEAEWTRREKEIKRQFWRLVLESLRAGERRAA